jgi:protein NrfD
MALADSYLSLPWRIAAGILFFAALFTIMGKADKMEATVKKAPILVPIALVLGLIACFSI